MHPFQRTAALLAALACTSAPAYAQSVNTSQVGSAGQISFTPGFRPDPLDVQVSAGGPISGSELSETCNGNVSARPTYTVNFEGGLALIVSVSSDSDTTLAVLAPDGEWRCNDDYQGLNPGVSFEDPRTGRYQVWVGTYSAGEPVPAVLRISGGMPDPQLGAEHGEAYLVSGYLPDPHQQIVIAGGPYRASEVQGDCVGYVARAPDYRVSFTAGERGLPLIFSATSEVDTTLVINDPSGTWMCNDDGEYGLNPSVRFDAPQTGVYEVWVGTFARGTPQPATLYVSELTSH